MAKSKGATLTRGKAATAEVVEPVEFQGKTCEETYVMAGNTSRRCGVTAVMLVKRRGRLERPYFMCIEHGERNAKKHDLEVLARMPEPENPEVSLVMAEASAVSQWVGNVRQFFQRATELELGAKALLVRVEGLQAPTNGSQDAQIQDLVRLANGGKKEIEAHWTITRVFDALHKRAVQGRKRGTDAYEQAANIGNRLHASYVEAERRRAREEEDRLRREAEERARQEREAELAKLEQEALNAETDSPDLSDRERIFVDRHTEHHNPVTAARQAGFKNPDATALRLLQTPKIQQAIAAIENAAKLRQQAAAVRTAPVMVEDVEVRPDIQKGGDRVTWSGRVLDEQKVIDWILRTGQNRDLLCINQTAVNVLARSLRENLDRIDGLQHVKKTSVY